jgi:hypothetical protein
LIVTLLFVLKKTLVQRFNLKNKTKTVVHNDALENIEKGKIYKSKILREQI